jgi:UDP-N-acetylmuramoylalanine--D-glutamate ligase
MVAEGETARFDVRGKRAVVVGGADSGVAAAQLLLARGAKVTLTDLCPTLRDEARLRDAGVTLVLGDHPLQLLVQSDLIVVSPGVPLGQPVLGAARAAGVPIIGEVELAARWLLGRVIAVTGTKGKSTTTTLIGRILAQSGIRTEVGGNLGPPLSAQVADSTPDTVHVVEVSSFQLETTERFHPWIAVLLNFSADHLDRHESLDEYAGAKVRVFANQSGEDWAVLNADDPKVLQMAASARARRRLFALRAPMPEGVTVAGDQIVERTGHGEHPLLGVSKVHLIGPHLLSDVLAAVAVARIAGVSADAIARAVDAYRGLEHAMELVDEFAGVRFVNDSKATNIESARSSMETFDRGLVVILGGRYKGGDFADLREALLSRGASVVAIGEARPLIEQALSGAVPVHAAESMSDAVRLAFRAAPPGSSVVLAPACASFDMFVNYAHRGRAFKAEVARLRQEVAPGA